MNDYKSRFEKWQKDAKEKIEEVDRQLGLKDKISEGARVVGETAQKGAQKIKTEAEKSEVGKQAVRAAGETINTAGKAAKKAWDASEPIRDKAGEVGSKAGEAAYEAGKKAADFAADAGKTVGKNAERVGKAFSFGASWTRTIDSAVKSLTSAAGWIQDDPLRAATTGVSMAVGAGVGIVFTGISSHWLFNSALPTWSVKKIGESFNDYLNRRELLIEEGRLTDAEAERVRFERDIAKRIGAPLLGAFSFASGAVMMTNVLNPKMVTGFPIDLILGGNPALESVWFFANGLVCFRTSYDFFMIALDGQQDVQNLVREVKGMLPQPAEPAA
jgi:hypothetical protein